MATNGFMPFDARDFLLQEQSFKKRRKQKRETKNKKEQKTEWVAHMKARRMAVDLGGSRVPSPEYEEEEIGPIPFGSAPQSPRTEGDSARATSHFRSGAAAVRSLVKMSKMLSQRDGTTRGSVTTTRGSVTAE